MEIKPVGPVERTSFNTKKKLNTKFEKDKDKKEDKNAPTFEDILRETEVKRKREEDYER